MKIQLFERNGQKYVGFVCPCGQCGYRGDAYKELPVDSPDGRGWFFNYDLHNPSFLHRNPHPSSILTQWEDESGKKVCHGWLENGHIRFAGDCTHPFANQTLPLPEIPDKWLK